MNGILHKVCARALLLVDKVDDLIVEAALGFGAAAPIIADINGDAPSESNRTEYEAPTRRPSR